MATTAQITAVKELHETNDRTLNGTEYPAEVPYDIASPVTKTKDDLGADLLAFGDPYELYYAGKTDSNG